MGAMCCGSSTEAARAALRAAPKSSMVHALSARLEPLAWNRGREELAA
eukprot:CAMPEP_0180004034 /NCGR_PEP_ID=MMETSP0984-20121128/11873_1 /TAXON_ID=483367 /ORGANISM="non described non described, Strain CCMP 2436" /LENGTH=47 /DNA_ID= /DNA_START= /DNA_END= /DNA_ORIENTATION=